MGTATRRTLGALLLLGAVFFALPRGAAAQTSGDAQIWSREPGVVSGSVQVLSSTPGVTDPGSRGSVEVFAQRYDDWQWCDPTRGCGQWDWRCDPDASPVTIYRYNGDGTPDSGSPEGLTGDPIRYSVKPIDDAFAYGDGTTMVWCAGAGHEAPSVDQPPTLDEIWRSGSIAGAGPLVHILPVGHGLTGLTAPLWLTLSVGAVQNLDINIRGWSVRATVWLDRIEWRIADAATDTVVATEGRSAVTAGGVALGSQQDPISTFRFRTKGIYKVTGTAVWRAEGTIGIAELGVSIPIAFPDAGISSSYDYPVDELVGVLDRQPR